MRRLLKSVGLAVAAASLAAGGAMAETRGVSDGEIVIGSNQDLSGIFAAFGAPAVNAANLYFDEINAGGGVHGRKIRFVVEDHGYQMPKAMQALNKLVNSDKVFVMLLSLGTPMNVAAFPLLEKNKIANVSPLTAARQMIDPPSPYKYTGFSSYYDQIKAGIAYLAEKEGSKVICSMYIPSDFGKEIKEGAVDISREMGLTYKAETTHKPDEQDFVGSLTKLKGEGCQAIALALGVRQVITAVATAKKIGWTDVKFMGSSAAFHTAVAKVPGGITEGFYAAAGWVDLAARLDDADVKAWVGKYKAKFGEFPGTGALLGRSAAETLVRALEAAGRDLTAESFQKGMESLSYEDKIAGVPITYSADDHQGGDLIVVSVIRNGGWVELTRK